LLRAPLGSARGNLRSPRVAVPPASAIQQIDRRAIALVADRYYAAAGVAVLRPYKLTVLARPADGRAMPRMCAGNGVDLAPSAALGTSSARIDCAAFMWWLKTTTHKDSPKFTQTLKPTSHKDSSVPTQTLEHVHPCSGVYEYGDKEMA
jgi:hypothetical protein